MVDETLKLVPRYAEQGYQEQDLEARRAWLTEQISAPLQHIGHYSIDSRQMRGNIENPIGVSQIPLAIAGPLLINGKYAQGSFYVPMATTEGALIRSYERGMVALSRAGGVETCVHRDENQICPMFFFQNLQDAIAFKVFIEQAFDAIRKVAEATTRHGKLIALECQPMGRKVIVIFRYSTGDAQGMNMIVKATDVACAFIAEQHTAVQRYYLFSGMSLEKQAGGYGLSRTKGKKVTACVQIPAMLLKAYFHVTPEQLQDFWISTMLGFKQAGAIGYNGHYANGLAAIFIACGQDVANIVNSTAGITQFEVTEQGDLCASVDLSSLTVATVGGGTSLGTQKECLQIMDCYGASKARKFAEIISASLLAGELSFAAAIASGEFVDAHESYGRNRFAPEDQ